jgi:hypothetical protein
MTFDELRKNWQSQQDCFGLNIDSELLLKEVKRNKDYFQAMIFWRDFREVGCAVLLFFVFLFFGIIINMWPLYLLAFISLGVGGFMVVDRICAKRRQPKFNGTLTSCIEGSLAEVKHQIWLLKNVLWWYLLPPAIGLGIFIVHLAISIIHNLSGKYSVSGLLFIVGYSVFCVLLFWGVYCLNQMAVRKELNPRKLELEELLNSLGED